MGPKYAWLFVLLLTSVAGTSQPTRFEVRDAGQRDLVQFTSDAPLDKIVGTNHAIAGWLSLDPKDLSKGLSGEFKVDMRAFDTGMALRNKHLRDKFLETSKYPYATLELGKMKRVRRKNLHTSASDLSIEATLRVKNLTRQLPVRLKLTYFKESQRTRQRLTGNLLRVRSSFSLDLKEFGIPWEKALALRLTRLIGVQVDMLASDNPPSKKFMPPEPKLPDWLMPSP